MIQPRVLFALGMFRLTSLWKPAARFIVLLTILTTGAAHAAIFPSSEMLLAISPRASPNLVAAVVQGRSRIESAGLTNDTRFAHFLAQILTETGGLRRLDENMIYSAPRLVDVFSISLSAANQIAGNGRATANYVYGGRLGNGSRQTDDGWNYRGSGYIQLTGRYNFRARGIEINRPLEDQPDLVRQPADGLNAALAFWTARKINATVDVNNSVHAVRKRINPAGEGYGAALVWYRRVGLVLTGAQAANETNELSGETDLPTSDDVGGVLRELGFLSKSNNEAASADELTNALKAFQSSRSLPATGKVDIETLYELTDPRNWRRSGPVPLNNVNPDRRAGITYDLTTKQLSLVASKGSSEPLAQTAAQSGFGPQNPRTLTTADAASLNETAPFFAPYEVSEGIKKPDGNFVPFSVIWPDTRVVVNPTINAPSSSVVQITFLKASGGSRFACSGTMVSENVVLTAGHCVHDGGTSGDWHQDFTIIPARNGRALPFGTCKATKLYSVTGWVQAETSDEGKLYDIGAIHLDCNIGKETGWLGLDTVVDGGTPIPATIYGYPCDKRPVGRQWKSTGDIELITESKLFYKNDTYGCMSGSPVLVAGNKVVGVHTNGLFGDEPWSSYNSATRLSKDIIANVAAWMKD